MTIIQRSRSYTMDLPNSSTPGRRPASRTRDLTPQETSRQRAVLRDRPPESAQPESLSSLRQLHGVTPDEGRVTAGLYPLALGRPEVQDGGVARLPPKAPRGGPSLGVLALVALASLRLWPQRCPCSHTASLLLSQISSYRDTCRWTEDPSRQSRTIASWDP